MNLRQALLDDFGIEVLVGRGSGLRDDPFVIQPCSAAEATRTQLNLLRGLGRGRGELWRLLSSESALDVAAKIQRLRIESVEITQDRIISQRRAYYFDVSQVDGVPDAGAPLIEWTDPRTRFSAIYQIGWLHFDRALDNRPGQSRIDTTLQYSALGAKAAIYVYGLIDRSSQGVSCSELRSRELQSVCDQVYAVNPDAKASWPVHVTEPFALQYFVSGEDLTVAGVAVLREHFVKLRLTFLDEVTMRELMYATIQELGTLVQMSSLGGYVTSGVLH